MLPRGKHVHGELNRPQAEVSHVQGHKSWYQEGNTAGTHRFDLRRMQEVGYLFHEERQTKRESDFACHIRRPGLLRVHQGQHYELDFSKPDYLKLVRMFEIIGKNGLKEVDWSRKVEWDFPESIPTPRKRFFNKHHI